LFVNGSNPFRSISGKSVVVDTDICDDWLKNKLPNLVKNYKACDIFNAEETGLFYKLMPNKTLQLKGEKCHGGTLKRSKHHVLGLKSLSPSFLANSYDFAIKIGPLIGIFWLRLSLNHSYKAASDGSEKI
jgi:hypothetical protein